MTVQGLHHITLVCANAQQTVDFYTQVLGQRLVKKTVNFDDPGSYHLYFGESLKLPPWLEAHRSEIERRLRPITLAPWREAAVA